MNAAKIVTDAILGTDRKVVIVAGNAYVIKPPTIHQIAGAANSLAFSADNDNILDLIKGQTMEAAAEALSWFIQDNAKLKRKLMKGTLAEVVAGLHAAYSLISVEDFILLSTLQKNVARMAANQRA